MIQGSGAPSRILFATLAFACFGPMAACHADLMTPNGNPTGASIAYSPTVVGGYAALGPPQAGFITYSANDQYLSNALTAQGFTSMNGWNFVAGTMTGSLVLDKYYAFADSSPAYTDGKISVDANDAPGSGGAFIALTYSPMGKDPTMNIHWLQVIRTNDPSSFGTKTGFTSNADPGFTYYVDDGYGGVAGGVPAAPFYDNGAIGYAADGSNFIDTPYRPYVDNAIWNAEDFLVQDNTMVVMGKTVHTETVLGGVYYGFSTGVPEPSSVVLTAIALGSVGLVGLGRRRARRQAA